MGATIRRRTAAFGLAFTLLCALTLAVVNQATSTTRATHAGHFGKKVVVTAFDQYGPSPRLDQPVAIAPHAPRSLDRGVLARDAPAPAEPAVAAAAALHTRGPPAGR